MFSIRDYTSTIVDSTADYTEDFGEILILLKIRLTRANNLDTKDVIVNTNLAQHDMKPSENPSPNPMKEDNTRVLRKYSHTARYTASSRINSNSGDWRVLDNLWNEAKPDKKTLFNEIKRRGKENMEARQENQSKSRTKK